MTEQREAAKPDYSRFRVAARTLIHLGRELITSDEIAINELLKNAFDAGSPGLSIRMMCPIPQALASHSALRLHAAVKAKKSLASELRGVIEDIERRTHVNDYGPDTRQHLKSKLEELGVATKLERMVEVLEEINFVEVADTGCGISPADLPAVFLTVGTDYKLRSPTPEGVDEYLGNKGIGRLAMMRLGDRAEVKSWVQGQSKAFIVRFDWREFDNASRELSEIPIEVRSTRATEDSPSGTRIRIYALTSDWPVQRVAHGELKSFIRRLRSPFKKNRGFKISLRANDHTAVPFPPLSRTLRDLADQHLLIDFYPQDAHDEHQEILTVTIKRQADDLSPDRQTLTAKAVGHKLEATLVSLREIGPFSLNILRFNRRRLREKAGDTIVQMRKELDVWGGGIAIYRDGFRIGFTGSDRDGDWLGLDHRALRGGGYIVNRIQVIGAIDISHAGNPKLIDLTNREGLVTNEPAELLKRLLVSFGIDPLRAFVELAEQAERKQELEHLINEGTGTLTDRLELAKRDISTLRVAVPEKYQSSVNALDQHMHFIETQIARFDTAIEKVYEHREDILELAGIGNVMHGVMHELTRTTAQTRTLMKELASEADSQTQLVLTKLEGEIRAINTRLRQLDPLMPGGRQVKRDIDVAKLAGTVLEGYSGRFERHHIKACLKVIPPNQSVTVRMVPGFLSLALENLISNAVYWVGRQDGSRKIDVEVDAKSRTVSVTDNGPGVASTDRERIFLPGISLRPGGKGYGLYLAREVAEYHGGKLYMDPAGKDGLLHTFVLELPGERKS